MKDSTWYLAGPMTGYPRDNLPAFIDAASALRVNGFSIATPSEFEGDEILQRVLAGEGTFNELAGKTWGFVLGRDVELIADEMKGVIFLPGWEKSRGARLEAFVALLCGHRFARYVPFGQLEAMHPHAVLTHLSRATFVELRDGS